MRWVTMSDVYMDKSNVFAIDREEGRVARSRTRCATRSSPPSATAAARSSRSGSRCRRTAARARPTCRCASRSRCCSSTRSTGSPATRRICSRPTPPARASASRSTAWSARPRPRSAAPTAAITHTPVIDGLATFYGSRVGYYDLAAKAPDGSRSRRSSSPRTWRRPTESDIAPSTELTLGGKKLEAPEAFAITRSQKLWIYLVLLATALDRRRVDHLPPADHRLMSTSRSPACAARRRSLIRLAIAIAAAIAHLPRRSTSWIADRTSIHVDWLPARADRSARRRSWLHLVAIVPAFFLLRVLSLTDLSLLQQVAAGDAALARHRRRSRSRWRGRRGSPRQSKVATVVLVDVSRLGLRQAARRRAQRTSTSSTQRRGRRQPPAGHVRREAARSRKPTTASRCRRRSRATPAPAPAPTPRPRCSSRTACTPTATCRAW